MRTCLEPEARPLARQQSTDGPFAVQQTAGYQDQHSGRASPQHDQQQREHQQQREQQQLERRQRREARRQSPAFTPSHCPPVRSPLFNVPCPGAGRIMRMPDLRFE